MYFSNSSKILHLCCDIGWGNWLLGRVSKIMCSNGEPLILFLNIVIICCMLFWHLIYWYSDVFLSSSLGVFAPVLWWPWCCTYYICLIVIKVLSLSHKNKNKKKTKQNKTKKKLATQTRLNPKLNEVLTQPTMGVREYSLAFGSDSWWRVKNGVTT